MIEDEMFDELGYDLCYRDDVRFGNLEWRRPWNTITINKIHELKGKQGTFFSPYKFVFFYFKK